MGRRKIKSIPHHVRERLRHQNLQKILEDVANHVPKPMTVQKETKTKKLRRVVLYVKYLLLKEKELNKTSAGHKQTSKKQGILLKRKTAFQKVPLKCKVKDPKAHIVFLTKSSEKNVPSEGLASSNDAKNQPKADSFHAVSCSTVPTSAYMPNGGIEIGFNDNFQLWTDQSVEDSDRIVNKGESGTVKDNCVVERQTSSLNQNELLYKDSYFTDPKRNQCFSFEENTKNFATSLKENQSDYVPEKYDLPCQFKKSTFSYKKDVLNSLGTNDPEYKKPIDLEFFIDEKNFKFQSNISPAIGKEFTNYSGLQRKKPSTNHLSFSQNSDNFSSEFFSSGESGPLTSSNEYILSDDEYNGFIEIPYQNQNLKLSFVPETAHDEDNFENNFVSIRRSHDINSSPDIFVPNTSVNFAYNNANNKHGKSNIISNSERSNFSQCESATVYKDPGPVDRFLNMHCDMNLYPPYLAQNFQGVFNQTVNSEHIMKPFNFTPRDENFMKGFYLPQQSNLDQPIQIKQEPLLPAEEPSYSFNNFDYSNNWFMDNFNTH